MGRSPIGRPRRRSNPAREPPGMSSSASAAGSSTPPAADGTTAWSLTTCGASAASLSISASRAAERSPAAKSLSASGCCAGQPRRWRALYTVPPLPWPRTEILSKSERRTSEEVDGATAGCCCCCGAGGGRRAK
ncbi:Os03g0225150 [Oryza sativa Japonica Group]|uniref:Os03g0225150 protein n=1 Tax=Oryza sativa subsp. japonica TaxID=39947 RepID=A0A0P0VUY3_ORYSJ|nr:Os03g0225150 [Oryza sativa Japonica Group]